LVMSLPSSSSFSPEPSAAEDEDDVREYCDDYAVNEKKNKSNATTTRTMVVPPP